MADAIIEILVPGPPGSDIARSFLETGDNTYSVPENRTKDYWIRLTAQCTVSLPAATGGGLLHIKNDFDATSYITATNIEGVTSLPIYYGEVFDLVPIAGKWRVY